MIDPVPDTVYPIVFRLQIPVQGPGFAAGVEFVGAPCAPNPHCPSFGSRGCPSPGAPQELEQQVRQDPRDPR